MEIKQILRYSLTAIYFLGACLVFAYNILKCEKYGNTIGVRKMKSRGITND